MSNGDTAVHPAVMAQPRPAAVPLALVVGNALEFYDFILYAMFAPLIARQFFPAADPANGLLLALAGLAVGFVARPVGALLIGHLADRHGRRPALLLSLGLMASGTALLALLPGHATIGLAAPLLVVLARIAQGLSAGGEIGAASALLLESGTARTAAQRQGWQIASQGAAALAAAGSAWLVHVLLTPQALQAWGWRLPFLAGLLIVPIGLRLRRHLDEPVRPAAPALPVRVLLGEHRRTLLLAIAMIGGGTVQTQLIGQHLPTYLQTQLHYPARYAYLIAAMVGAVLLAAPLAGRIGDRLGSRKHLLYLAYALTMLLAVPAFALLASAGARAWALLPIAALTAVQCLGAGCGLAILLEGFPATLRASALGLAYSIGVAVFGGTTPLVVAWLGQASGNPLAPAWYLMAAATLSVLAVWRYPQPRQRRPEPAALPAAAPVTG